MNSTLNKINEQVIVIIGASSGIGLATAVDTPFPQHARTCMANQPKLPSPQIEPDEVATAILDIAETPTRGKQVGAMGVVNTVMSKIAPRLADKMSSTDVDRQNYDEPPGSPRAGCIYSAK